MPTHLFRICSDKIKLMKFLCDTDMIKRRRKCARRNCRRNMCFIRDRTSPDHFRFRCPKCKSSQSIRKGSFFEQSRLSIPQTLYVTCCWACKIPVKSAAFISDVCDRSVSQWDAFLREKCSQSLLDSPNYSFGGVGVVCKLMRASSPRESTMLVTWYSSSGYSDCIRYHDQTWSHPTGG